MVDKLEAVEVTQAERNALWAGMVDEMKAQPIGYDEEETSPLSDEDWSNYPGDLVEKAALRALAAQRATPANGEQVERIKVLEEALEPFAALAGTFDAVSWNYLGVGIDGHLGSTSLPVGGEEARKTCGITIDDLIRARTALGDKETDRHG